jgi:hypothetical protein
LVKIIHLLFADDVLIMTNDNLSEWQEINGLLNLFCASTGLQINWNKCMFHHTNITDRDLDPLMAIFPHKFLHLSLGFHYLGYFIKVEQHKASDWDWLLTKVKIKINNWRNIWLIIRGRYTLLKATLEGQPVCWMALAAISPTVLEKLRRLTFNFFWSGC